MVMGILMTPAVVDRIFYFSETYLACEIEYFRFSVATFVMKTEVYC